MGRVAALARLALETASTRAAIDEALLGPLDFLDTASYRRFLCLVYGFQAPLEAALDLTPGIDLEFLHERRRVAPIAADLMSLGLTRQEFHLLSRRQTIGPFASVPEALGWMYATERLGLHLETLRIRIENEMPVVYELACQYLAASRNVVELRWRGYGRLLDRVGHADDIVAAGIAGLDSFRSWLVANGAPIRHASAERQLLA